MIKVDQTLFGNGKGNCLPACIATITGIPLDTIPNFCVLYASNQWYFEMIKWLRPYGLAPWSATLDIDDVKGWVSKQFPDIPWIATGHTARGNHSCVFVGGGFYHDPNPCRDGLLDVIDGTFFLSKQVQTLASR